MQSLAVKYRPKTFDEVVEQAAISAILTQQVLTSTFKHAYLFTGPAGCGKTTAARIFANMLNDGKGTPYEVDAASNNGVDNVRDIIDNSRRKALDTQYKVYIIDEVHMLSQGAFNALLKTLEEAPSGTIFILCTTDPQKVPATILSRVQRYDFSKISTDNIIERLKYILLCENEEALEHGCDDFLTYTDDAISMIAKLAEGGMRDAITMLDQCISYSPAIDIQCVMTVLGTIDYDALFSMCFHLEGFDTLNAIQLVNDIYNEGKDIKQFVKQFQYFIIDLCKFKMFSSLEITKIPSTKENLEDANSLQFDFLVKVLDWIKELNSIIKYEDNPKATFECAIILACTSQIF